MIRNWEEHALHLDFSNLGVVCSDIDLLHITPSGFLVLGEIKSVKGYFTKGQRRLLQKIVDDYEKGGTILYIAHTKDVNKGDTIVDISECLVEEYYWGGEWITPQKFTTVKEAMNKLEGM